MITWGKYLSKYYETKGSIFALMGVASAIIIHFAPIAIALYLIFGKGKILLGILFPILWWATLSFFYVVLPFWWIGGIFKYGFIDSTLLCLTILVLFALPEFFFWFANRQMTKAEKTQELDSYRKEDKESNSLEEEDKTSDTREIEWKEI